MFELGLVSVSLEGVIVDPSNSRNVEGHVGCGRELAPPGSFFSLGVQQERTLCETAEGCLRWVVMQAARPCLKGEC